MRYPFSESVAKKSRSNFYPAFFFLPAEKREAICAIYAFSRFVDDSVDEATNRENARKEIQLWRQRLKSCYNGRLFDSHPLLPEISEVIRQFEISQSIFEDLLIGVEMDLVKTRYKTFEELEKYCYHVAGTVGLLCNQIFGGSSENHRAYALSLGTAFQLTNILRDIGGDLDRGRLYLPLEEVASFSCRVEDLEKKIENKAFFELMKFQASRAWGYFDQAKKRLSPSERNRFVTAEVMRRFYEGILKKMEREKFPSLRRRVGLGPIQKGRILLSSWIHLRTK
ncbi:MAG: squalene/phytoene synthase family protein [Deltaproteobacteria bacterium]|nr:squalene/phytoene synthase family protein [Deltaproteobacteria bacterium]